MGRAAHRAGLLCGALCAPAFASGCALLDAARAEGRADEGECLTTEVCGGGDADEGDSGGEDDAPTAVAGPDQSVNVGAAVRLDGRQSYPDDLAPP